MEWVVVVATAVGGLIALSGGWAQRRWEAKQSKEHHFRSIAIRFLSLPLNLIFEPGIFASPHVRRFAVFRSWFLSESLEVLRRSASAIIEVKSELDLVTDDPRIRASADQLLAASSSFVTLATSPRVPSGAELQQARDEIAKARQAFLTSVRLVLK